jgi:hypothetical protein
MEIHRLYGFPGTRLSGTSECSALERYEYGAGCPGMARAMCAGYQEYLVSRKSSVVRATVTVDQQALFCADSCFAPTLSS